MTNKVEKEIYNATEFAKIFGISKRTVTRYQVKGILPIRKNSINNYKYFLKEDLENFRKFIEGEGKNEGNESQNN